MLQTLNRKQKRTQVSDSTRTSFTRNPADFWKCLPIFQKSKPKNDVACKKVCFFGFSKIRFFGKIAQKFLRPPRFFGKKNLFYVKVSGFNHSFLRQKLEF